jgi:hypothetical protein
MTTTTISSRRAWFSLPAVAAAFTSVVLLAACKDKDPGTGLVVDAAVALPVEAGPAVDVAQCPGCQLAAQTAWTFEGVYRDSACTDPLAQIATPMCVPIPALGPISITYVDEVGVRKANEAANVTLSEQAAPEAPRYRKTAKGCVRANESATAITPVGCAGSKVCRDSNAALTCAAACRTFATGCPDFEETRMYAVINDPGLKTAKAATGDGNVARLAECCNQLAAEAKRLGTAPEAGMLNTAATQCLTLVKAAGPSGTAPELGALRAVLVGRKLPAVCAGF